MGDENKDEAVIDKYRDPGEKYITNKVYARNTSSMRRGTTIKGGRTYLLAAELKQQPGLATSRRLSSLRRGRVAHGVELGSVWCPRGRK